MTTETHRQQTKSFDAERNATNDAALQGARERGELTATPAQRASELVADMEAAVLVRNKARWQAARSELLTIIELL